MFEALGREIAALGDQGDADTVREFVRLREQFDAHGSVLIGEFDASLEWALDGAVNVTQWLTTHCRLSRDEAHRMKILGRCAHLFPATTAAFTTGEFSSAQVRAIGTNVTKELESVFADREADLVPYLIPLTQRSTERALKHWKQITQDEFGLGEPTKERETSQLRHKKRHDDTWHGDGTWNNDDGQLIDKALWRALHDDTTGEPARTHAQKMADSLVDICRHYLNYNNDPLAPRRLPHIAITMNINEFEEYRGGQYQDGTPVHPTTLRTTLCNAEFSRVIHNNSITLDYGRDQRNPPDSLRRVVIHRDHHCRFGTCDRPPQWCQTHHHQWWTQGGHTNLENLVLLCDRHHHLLHTPGWTSTLTPDGTLTITTPHGRTIQSRPPP